MIQFKCIYCGQGLSAQEDERGQKGKCPKCNHDFFVPKKADPKNDANRFDPEFTVPVDFSVHDVIFSKSEFFREDFKWLIPTYDELSLFLMAFTLIMLLVGNASMREQIYKLTTGFYKYFISKSSQSDTRFLDVVGIGSFLIAIMLFLCGLGLSIYHLYTTREKTSFEKETMLVFAVVTNIFTALAAGIYMFRESTGWTIIFPVWNLINAGLLITLVQHKMIDERCLSDREATFHQIIIGMTAIFIIFIFCNFVFELYWAVTFSVCIIYISSFDRALQSVFPGLMNRGDEQSS